MPGGAPRFQTAQPPEHSGGWDGQQQERPTNWGISGLAEDLTVNREEHVRWLPRPALRHLTPPAQADLDLLNSAGWYDNGG